MLPDEQWMMIKALEMLNRGFSPVAVERLIEQLGRKSFWKSAMATKTSAVARGLRAIERSIPKEIYVGRERQGDLWVFFAKDKSGETVAVATLEVPHPKRMADFEKPVQMKVLREDLLDPRPMEEACATNGKSATN